MTRTFPSPRIRWAPRVAQAPIARLYELDARGIRDDELVDKVGWALYGRARDVLCVAAGRVACPVCAQELAVAWSGEDADRAFACPGCGWRVTGRQYHESWQKQDLHGWGPALETYVQAFPRARDATERMLLIDALLHAVHENVRGRTGGNLARNLIEGGHRNSVHAFLDRLAYGDGSTVDGAARERWAATPLNRSRAGRSGGLGDDE